jgi:hypothetical protein
VSIFDEILQDLPIQPKEPYWQKHRRIERVRLRRVEEVVGSTDDVRRIQDACRHNEYALVSCSGDNPQVIVLGYTHPGNKIQQLDAIIAILKEILRDGDRVMMEGTRGEVNRKQSTSQGVKIRQGLKHRRFRISYNDDPRLLVEIRMQRMCIGIRGSVDGRTEIEELKIHALNRERDRLFCLDPATGLVPVAQRSAIDEVQLGPSNRVFQLIGYGHIVQGYLESHLKQAGVPYHIYVPFEYAKSDMRELSDVPDMEGVRLGWIQLIHELGYIGRNRRLLALLDEKFGWDGWLRGHTYGKALLTKSQALKLYEQSYFHFLKRNPGLLDWLSSTASEVYDNDVSNVSSGMDYDIQETEAAHYQDIAVRRALHRLGRRFQGDHLLQIRGVESEGYRLNPGQVPFLKPDLIHSTDEKQWYEKGSIEDFYQSNKVVVVDPARLVLSPEYVGPEGTYFKYDDHTYYLQRKEDLRTLYRMKGSRVRGLFNAERKKYVRLTHQPFQTMEAHQKSGESR